MNLPRITSYEVKTSRTQAVVPVINGVHLHSIYSPEKEAESLIANHLEQLKNKNEVLVLGLGYGYHINSLIDTMTSIHGDSFKIIVVEPSTQVYDDCINQNLLNKKNVVVYAGFEPKELYSDLELIHFLLAKPAIIAHPPSFNLYQLYFKTILTFSAPTDLASVKTFVSSPIIKTYLDQFDTTLSFDQAIYENLPRQKEMSEMDFLAMALVEMSQKTLQKTKQTTAEEVTV